METKKGLGQHFLVNKGVAERIAERVKNEKIVMEIGGGKGALTEKLLGLEKEALVVVELDNDMIHFLKKRFAKINDFYLVRADGAVVKVKKSCAVCGNLPYNAAKAIIKNFIFQYELIKKMVFMVQKEVAQTITAKTGTRQFGKFSVICQLFYDVAKLFDVKPGSFHPKPKVDSTVIEFRRKQSIPEVDKRFFSFLNVLFSHPRKTVKNNLGIYLDEKTGRKRPSELSIEEILALWRTKWQKQ